MDKSSYWFLVLLSYIFVSSWVFLAALTLSGEPDFLKGKSLVTEEQTVSLLVRIAQEGQVGGPSLSPFFSPPSILSVE